MKRLFKWIGTLAVVLIVLVIALAIAVPLLFDINDQKDRIAAIVERETGRELVITGDLELTVFPWLAVRTGAMALAQPDGFDPATPFAAFESAEVSVKLMPLLLRREFVVGRISLQGLQVQLLRDADGNDNWSDLTQREGGDGGPDAPRERGGTNLRDLEIAGISLSDARISFHDRAAGTGYVVEELNVISGPVRFGAPIEMSMDARVSSAVPQWRGQIEFIGRAHLHDDGRTVDAVAERFAASVEGGALPVDNASVDGALEVHGDLESGDWRVERVAITASAALARGERSLQGQASLAGSATLRGADQTVDIVLEQAVAEGTGSGLPLAAGRAELSGRISGDLTQRAWRVDRLALTGTARGGRLPDTDQAFSFSAARVVADLEAQTASAQDVRVDALGVRGTLSATGTGIVDAPVFNGTLAFEGFSPRAVLGMLDVALPETRDPTSLTHLAISTTFRATRSSISLTELDAELDASRLRGRFAVADFDSQALRFDLDLDQLDLDRYLGPETETVDPDAGEFDAIEIPVETIRALDIDGALRVANMRAFGLTTEAVAVTIRAQGGSLRVNPASARMYGGTYEGDIALDVRGATPRLSVNERVTGVQAGPLFEDLFDQARIVGTADMSARVTGSGLTVGAIRRTLDGRIAFSFRDGAVKGFDLWHMIRDARAVMRGEERPEQPTGEPQTAFGRLSGTGTVARGVMTSDDLNAQLPYMTVAGGGTFDLAESVMDYRLRVTVQRVPGVDGQEGDGELAGLSVPVVISGPVSDLSYRVDLASILRDRVQQEVDNARERLERELLDRLRRGIR